ncbi:MAG: hypothetical protein ACKO2C_01735 [Actinomycetes bacterium]
MAVSSPQEVLKDQIFSQPKRYEGYHEDLVEILQSALTAVKALDETPAARRARLGEVIRAKANQAVVRG